MSDDTSLVPVNCEQDVNMIFGRLTSADKHKLLISLLYPNSISHFDKQISDLNLEKEIEDQIDIYNLISTYINEQKIESFDNVLISLKPKDSFVPIIFGFDKFCTDPDEYLTAYTALFSTIITRYILNDPILVFKLALALFTAIPASIFNLNLINEEKHSQLVKEFSDFFNDKISPFMLKKLDYTHLLSTFLDNKENIKRENNITEEEFKKNPIFEILNSVTSIKDLLNILKDKPKLKAEFLNGLNAKPSDTNIDIEQYIKDFKFKYDIN